MSLESYQEKLGPRSGVAPGSPEEAAIFAGFKAEKAQEIAQHPQLIGGAEEFKHALDGTMNERASASGVIGNQAGREAVHAAIQEVTQEHQIPVNVAHPPSSTPGQQELMH